MIDLQEVGAYAQIPTAAGVAARFGIYLPGINAQDGYEVHVLVIHKADDFEQAIAARDFPLTQAADSPNNLWQAQVHIDVAAGTHFGQSGTYLYRYQLQQRLAHSDEKKLVTRWFTDPFAQATDIGLLSAFTTPDSLPEFEWTDQAWKVPELENLIVYELNVEEFNGSFEGVIERLPYLQSIGVTCLELMPVTSPKLNFDWGYAPLHYFASYQRWGGVAGLKRLVNACHARGVAVILDVVYQHVDPTFPYHLVYQDAGIDSPMIGGDGEFGPMIDYNKDFARAYVQASNLHWLYEYHIDGFRYDEVTDLYDGPMGVQYARIAYDTYNESLQIARFTPSGAAGEYSRLIQCPEALNRPQDILKNTYSNGTWQDGLLNMAENMAQSGSVDEHFGHQIILYEDYAGYPTAKTVHDRNGQPVDMPVAPFQYLESHDHSQLITYIATLGGDVPFGDRSLFYKLQPFAIALYTCEGTPMLWQGQEFAENYVLPASGYARIDYQRNVNWEYFYDEFGTPLVRLYSILGNLRQRYPALRSRESFYYWDQSRPQDKIIAYSRQSSANGQIAVVLLNFADLAQSISVPFAQAGTYREHIDDDVRQQPYDICVTAANQQINVTVPSHYGYIFIKEA